MPKPKKTIPSLTTPVKPGKMGLFTSFTMQPEGVGFEHQEADEQIILLLRRHLITNVPWIIVTLILLVLPLLVPTILTLTNQDLFFLIPDNFLLIYLSLYYLIVIGYALLNFVLWFYNVGLVTNFRVIDIDIVNFTSKNVSATAIDDIVDVEYTQQGFLQNTFDYGNVFMQTAGTKENFEFDLVPRPAVVADIVSDLIRDTDNG